MIGSFLGLHSLSCNLSSYLHCLLLGYGFLHLDSTFSLSFSSISLALSSCLSGLSFGFTGQSVSGTLRLSSSSLCSLGFPVSSPLCLSSCSALSRDFLAIDHYTGLSCSLRLSFQSFRLALCFCLGGFTLRL